MNFVVIIGSSLNIDNFNDIYAIVNVRVANPFYNEDLNQDTESNFEILADKLIFRNELNYLREKQTKIVLKGRLQIIDKCKLKIFAERIIIL